MQSEFTAALVCGAAGRGPKRTKPMQRAASTRAAHTLTRNRELTSKKYLSEAVEQKIGLKRERLLCGEATPPP